MADSDTVLAAVNTARQWVLENSTFEVSNAFVDGEYLVVDFRVTGPGGTVWFDDRNRILKPRLRVPDGTTTPTTEYQRPNGETLYLSQAEFNALTRQQQRALTPTGLTWDRPNYVLAPRQAILRDLLHTAKVVTQGWTVPHVMRDANGNLLGDTLTVFASNDVTLTSAGGTGGWSNTQAGDGTNGNNVSAASTNPNSVRAKGTVSRTISITFMDFDTSGLSTGATVSGYTISYAGTGTAETNTNNPDIETRVHNFGGGEATTGDWFNTASTGWTGKTLFAHLLLSSWNQTADTYNAQTSDGATSSINVTGSTQLVVGMSNMDDASAPSGDNLFQFRSSEQASTTSDPKLVITYTPGTIDITINSVTATATAAGNAPVPTIAMNPPVATATATANAPTASITGATTNVSSVTATATAAANAPAPTVSLKPPSATATAAANAPVPTVAPSSVTATATASANAPGMTRSLGSVAATSTAAANAPTPTVSIPSAEAQATATANAPGMTRSIGSVTATATATANAPTPSVVVSILSVTATATAMALAPFIAYTVWPLKVATAIGKKFAAALGLKKKHQAVVAIDQTYAVAMAPAMKHGAALAIDQTYRVEITMSSLTVYNGNSVIVTATFTTVASGAVADPDAIVFKVKDEHNNVTSYTYGTDSEVAKSSTGIYTCTYTPDADGEWITQATGTGAVAAVGQERLTVLPVI